MNGRLAHQAGAEDLEIFASKGSHVVGARGKKYLDFMMGWNVGNLGWGQSEIETALEGFDGPDYVYPGYRYRPWEELAGLLTEIVPGRLTRCFRATGGSEAVDLAMQAAMVHTGRRKFISIEGAYHGNSIAGLSVGSGDKQLLPNLLRDCRKIKPPLNNKSTAKVEALLKRRDVAAFIMEPIIINLGVLAPDPKFMERVRALCTHYGTLFIADEVAAGFGRTGKLFASEHFRLQPDILCLAKSVTGGAAVMGAMLTTATVGNSMEKKGEFYSTYGWHPRSTAAAIASINYFRKNQSRMLANIEEMSRYFRTRIEASKFERRPKISIWGLAVGVDVGSESYASKIQERARKAGLLFAAEGRGLLLLPALTLTHADAKEGLRILERCL